MKNGRDLKEHKTLVGTQTEFGTYPLINAIFPSGNQLETGLWKETSTTAVSFLTH
jgi:hypothetical protein